MQVFDSSSLIALIAIFGPTFAKFWASFQNFYGPYSKVRISFLPKNWRSFKDSDRKREKEREREREREREKEKERERLETELLTWRPVL